MHQEEQGRISHCPLVVEEGEGGLAEGGGGGGPPPGMGGGGGGRAPPGGGGGGGGTPFPRSKPSLGGLKTSSSSSSWRSVKSMSLIMSCRLRRRCIRSHWRSLSVFFSGCASSGSGLLAPACCWRFKPSLAAEIKPLESPAGRMGILLATSSRTDPFSLLTIPFT